jgi:4-hydroxyphenylpyruvate dioxygenase
MGPKRSIASLSLGRAWAQPLPKKLDEAAAHHYAGIELFHEDLEYIAKTMPGGLMPANQLLAAQQIREMCDERNLTIICLQPFMHYEGLVDRERHAERIKELKLWLRLCKVLGTDLIVIPSNFLDEGVTGDWEVLVADLREAADLGMQEEPMVRFAYEALCWATFVDTWSRSYDLVLAVDRPNFGICLDTFNICGREFADPASVTGCIPDAGEVMKKSLEKMRRDVDVRKIFLVQAADAEKMREPLREEHMFHVRGQKPRMSWSRNARLFPGEGSRGAYLPALEVMRVITGKDGLGYTGWISFEVFSRTLSDTRRGVPDEHARRGKQSWEWMESELGGGQ